MPLEMKLYLKLEQQLKLSQKIEFSNFLSVPDEVLSTVLGAISFNPDNTESILREERKKHINRKSGVNVLYPSLNPLNGNPDYRRGGIIVNPDLRAIEGYLENYKINVAPDVTYIGRKNLKPEVVFSDHIKGPSMMISLELEKTKYPETVKLMNNLRRFDEWKRSKLREIYIILGDAQRDFFDDFDRTKCKILNMENLADETDISWGTASRIMSNRYVEVRSVSGDQKYFQSKELLVTKDELKKYIVLPKINELLREEFEKGAAYSDKKIIRRADIELSRRALVKYRKEFGIPNSLERDKAYKNGDMLEPYKFYVVYKKMKPDKLF